MFVIINYQKISCIFHKVFTTYLISSFKILSVCLLLLHYLRWRIHYSSCHMGDVVWMPKQTKDMIRKYSEEKPSPLIPFSANPKLSLCAKSFSKCFGFCLQKQLKSVCFFLPPILVNCFSLPGTTIIT